MRVLERICQTFGSILLKTTGRGAKQHKNMSPDNYGTPCRYLCVNAFSYKAAYRGLVVGNSNSQRCLQVGMVMDVRRNIGQLSRREGQDQRLVLSSLSTHRNSTSISYLSRSLYVLYMRKRVTWGGHGFSGVGHRSRGPAIPVAALRLH